MTNLILHCGANAVPANEVRLAPTPAATESHFPVPHAELVAAALEMARNDFGLTVVNQAHGMTKGGARYFGLFELESDGSDYAPVIGLRNAHDKSFSASIALGSSVFVCDNLAFSGEVKLARKHTRHILRDLPVLMGRAFERLGKVRENQSRRIEAYKEARLALPEQDHLLVEAARCGALAWSGIGKVIAELENPTHTPEEFGVERDSAWNIFNACTEVLKTRGQTGHDPRWTQFLHRVFDRAVGLGDEMVVDLDEADWETA